MKSNKDLTILEQAAIYVATSLPSFNVLPIKKSNGLVCDTIKAVGKYGPRLRKQQRDELDYQLINFCIKPCKIKDSSTDRRVGNITVWFHLSDFTNIHELISNVSKSKIKQSSLLNNQGIKAKKDTPSNLRNFHEEIYIDTETQVILDTKKWEELCKIEKEEDRIKSIKEYLKSCSSYPWSIAYSKKADIEKAFCNLRRASNRPYLLKIARKIITKPNKGETLDDTINNTIDDLIKGTTIYVPNLGSFRDAYGLSNPLVYDLVLEILSKDPSIKVSIDTTGIHSLFTNEILDAGINFRFVAHCAAFDIPHLNQPFLRQGLKTFFSLQMMNKTKVVLPNTGAIKIMDDTRVTTSMFFRDTMLYHRTRLSNSDYKDTVPYNLSNMSIDGDNINYYCYKDNIAKSFSFSTYIPYIRKDIAALYLLDLRQRINTNIVTSLLGLENIIDRDKFNTVANTGFNYLRYYSLTSQIKFSDFDKSNILNLLSTLRAKPNKSEVDLKHINFIEKYIDNEKLGQFFYKWSINEILNKGDDEWHKDRVDYLFAASGQIYSGDHKHLLFREIVRPNVELYPPDFFPTNLPSIDNRLCKPLVNNWGDNKSKYLSIYYMNSGGFTFHNTNYRNGYICKDDETIWSIDINSSYPYQMSKGIPVGVPSHKPLPHWVNPIKLYRIQLTSKNIKWLKQYDFLGHEFMDEDKFDSLNSSNKTIVYSRLPLSSKQQVAARLGLLYLYEDFYNQLVKMVPPGTFKILDTWYLERYTCLTPAIQKLYQLRQGIAYLSDNKDTPIKIKDTVLGEVCKLCLNASYGKTASQDYEYTKWIVNGYKDSKIDNEVQEWHGNLCGAYVTQLGQTQLLDAICKLVDKGFTVLGGDTDSIKVLTKKGEEYRIKKILKIDELELGGWKLEGQLKALIYNPAIRKKYLGIPWDLNSIDICCKLSGINNKYIKAIIKARLPEDLLINLFSTETNYCFKDCKNEDVTNNEGSIIIISSNVETNNTNPITAYVSISPSNDFLIFTNPEGIETLYAI